MGVTFTERRYFREPITGAELSELVRLAGGVEPLVSTRTKAYKDLGLEGRKISEEEWTRLLQTEPRLLRRPLLTDGQQIVIGYDEAAIRSLAGA